MLDPAIPLVAKTREQCKIPAFDRPVKGTREASSSRTASA